MTPEEERAARYGYDSAHEEARAHYQPMLDEQQATIDTLTAKLAALTVTVTDLHAEAMNTVYCGSYVSVTGGARDENIYYKTVKFEGRTVKDAVRPLFPEGADDGHYELNWLFLSTSGVHGTYYKLDDGAVSYDEESDATVDRPRDWPRTVTCLVVHPRTCTLRWGELYYDEDDEPWLREAVAQTIAGVARSQLGNLPLPPR